MRNSSENISVDTVDNVTLNIRKDFNKSDILVSGHYLLETNIYLVLKQTRSELKQVVSDFLKSFSSSGLDLREEEAAAKLVMEGVLLLTVSSFGFLGKFRFIYTTYFIFLLCSIAIYC